MRGEASREAESSASAFLLENETFSAFAVRLSESVSPLNTSLADIKCD